MKSDIKYTVIATGPDGKKAVRCFGSDTGAGSAIRSAVKKGAVDIKIYQGISDIKPVSKETYKRLTKGAFNNENHI